MTAFEIGQSEGDRYSFQPPTPESAGVIPDGLPTARLDPPYAIKFADFESIKLLSLALLDVSGERLWTTCLLQHRTLSTPESRAACTHLALP